MTVQQTNPMLSNHPELDSNLHPYIHHVALRLGEDFSHDILYRMLNAYDAYFQAIGKTIGVFAYGSVVNPDDLRTFPIFIQRYGLPSDANYTFDTRNGTWTVRHRGWWTLPTVAGDGYLTLPATLDGNKYHQYLRETDPETRHAKPYKYGKPSSRGRGRPAKLYEVGGKLMTVREIADAVGVSVTAIQLRIKRGVPIDKLLTARHVNISERREGVAVMPTAPDVYTEGHLGAAVVRDDRNLMTPSRTIVTPYMNDAEKDSWWQENGALLRAVIETNAVEYLTDDHRRFFIMHTQLGRAAPWLCMPEENRYGQPYPAWLGPESNYSRMVRAKLTDKELYDRIGELSALGSINYDIGLPSDIEWDVRNMFIPRAVVMSDPISAYLGAAMMGRDHDTIMEGLANVESFEDKIDRTLLLVEAFNNGELLRAPQGDTYQKIDGKIDWVQHKLVQGEVMTGRAFLELL